MTTKKKKNTVKIQVVPKKKVTISKPKKGKKKASSSRANGLLAQLGGIAGSQFGGPLGGALGMTAGALISRITGFGDYKVQQNSISMGNSVPTFSNGGAGIRVCHREFLSDVYGSVDFQLTAYAINPGLASSFPYLALIAQNFEEWDVHGLVYEYRPSSGSAVSSTSSALGVVILATDYDVLNTNFANKQQMESYEFSTSTVPFSACIHPVECARNRTVLNRLYTRTGGIPTGADQRMYDMGKFQIATVGMQSVYIVGELWCSYDITFGKPRIPPTLGFQYVHFVENPIATSTAALPFGTTGPAVRSGGLPGIVFWSQTAILFPFPGSYFIHCVSSGAGASQSVVQTLGANIAIGPTVFSGGGVSTIGTAAAATGQRVSTIVVLAAGTGTANSVSYSVTGLTAGAFDVFIFPVPTAGLLSPALMTMPPTRPIARGESLTYHFVPDKEEKVEDTY